MRSANCISCGLLHHVLLIREVAYDLRRAVCDLVKVGSCHHVTEGDNRIIVRALKLKTAM